MLMTPTEASSVWCPMARVIFIKDDSVPSGQPAWNRVQPDQPEAEVRATTATMCLGNRCAMWRWVDDQPVDVRRGYCGLAGSPVT